MSTTNPPPANTPPVATSALLNVNYGAVSILSMWLYEYAITFDDEITFLRESRWSIVKIVYLVCRYLMFPFVITNTFRFLQRSLTVQQCKSYFEFTSFACATIIVCAELMFLARTYALWRRSRTALIIIIVNFTVFLIPAIVILTAIDTVVTMVPVSGITSCDDNSGSNVTVWAYVLLVIGETEILISTLYRAVRYYREAGGRNRLLAILVQHNTFYFCCSLASSVTMISTMYLLQGQDNDLFADHTWDTGYSNAPLHVEFEPEADNPIKSAVE
ncbi:hypothetical protein PAXINDRAFT_15994 [Paxillus involutus ATCC 200175]|uniref:DUF6533 domain-containing protein n=1 Tax=Paxillus involutus ATCC 200175 TaxID=664439 RepID=A0A0C9TTB9_PAXIN|nr:hypothetical protein PAXINDRAFT_15994 [Paxillus involutus ATCC 200175]